MSIFKTTLNVESTDQSTPIKLTASYNNNLLDNVVMGKVTINTNLTEIPLSGDNSRGSFLYIKSSEKNPKQNIIGIVTGGGVITLSPGEFAAVPLYSFVGEGQQGPTPFGNNLAAFTTNGTAELEYFTGSRGEDVGENVLVRFQDTVSGTWKFFTLDVNTAIPGQGPAMFMSDGTVDTQISYNDYPNSIIQSIVNRKGYIIRFYDGDGNNKFVFINSRGAIIDTENINQSFSSYHGEGRANLITWYDGDDGHVIYFDGDNYWTHDFINIDSIYVEDNWDACTADGTFPVYIEGYDGDSDIEAQFLIKGGDKTLIKTTNAGSDYIYSNSYAYAYGNFIAVETIWDDDNNQRELNTFEIFSTDGTLLKTVDFDAMPFDTRDYYFYGSGKMQFVYEDDDSGDYIFLNYNQLTGKLIGEDLTWTSDYSNYEVVCDNYYTGWGMDYKPESVAIIKYFNDGINNNYFLNQDTDGDLEVTYIINNDLEQRNYIVPNTEDLYYASNAYNNNNYATDKDFVLLSGDNRTSGPLVATRFTSGAEPTRFNLINDLSAYNVFDSEELGIGAYVECFGDYRALWVRTNTGNTNREWIVYDSKVLDKVSIYWDDNGHDVAFNTLIAIDYDVNKEWYFNTSTKKWTLLPTFTDGYRFNGGVEGDQYPVGTGKILFVRGQYTPTLDTINGRMITRGVAGNEKELLKIENIYSSNLEMGAETIVLSYQETSNSNWKVRVFDLNLNFLYEVDTEKPSYSNYAYYGKLIWWLFSDNNGNYTHYKFGKLLSSLTLSHPYGYIQAFNNREFLNNQPA